MADLASGWQRKQVAGGQSPMNRRTFLKLAGAAGAATVAGTGTSEAAPVGRISDDWMGMLTDHTLCVGCRKCEWACRDANGLPNQQPIEAYE